MMKCTFYCVTYSVTYSPLLENSQTKEEYLKIPVCMHTFFLFTANTSAVFVLILMECLILLFGLEFLV